MCRALFTGAQASSPASSDRWEGKSRVTALQSMLFGLHKTVLRPRLQHGGPEDRTK